VLDEGAASPGDMGAAEQVEIRIERVDDHLSGPVDVVKIDTQGSEWLALRGAERLLADSPRLALLMEFWPYALRGCEPHEMLSLLASLGFRLGMRKGKAGVRLQIVLRLLGNRRHLSVVELKRAV
jgi:hypothetical protein